MDGGDSKMEGPMTEASKYPSRPEPTRLEIGSLNAACWSVDRKLYAQRRMSKD